MRYLLFLLVVGICSCEPQRGDGDFQAMAYVPIYLNSGSDTAINSAAPKASIRPGKIYAYGNYLFQVEQNEGIHIINNSNPQQAQKISFLKIPSATEIAIKSNYLYTNHFDDLVVFDLSNISAPRLVSRIENAFPEINQNYPPFTNVQFECADPARGFVVGWEEKLIDHPKCRR